MKTAANSHMDRGRASISCHNINARISKWIQPFGTAQPWSSFVMPYVRRRNGRCSKSSHCQVNDSWMGSRACLSLYSRLNGTSRRPAIEVSENIHRRDGRVRSRLLFSTFPPPLSAHVRMRYTILPQGYSHIRMSPREPYFFRVVKTLRICWAF